MTFQFSVWKNNGKFTQHQKYLNLLLTIVQLNILGGTDLFSSSVLQRKNINAYKKYNNWQGQPYFHAGP